MALERVVVSLRRGGIPYALIGAWALSLWGKPRATLDLDFLVSIGTEEVERLEALMIRAGAKPDTAWQQWNPLLRDSQARFQYGGITIDLLRARSTRSRNLWSAAEDEGIDGIINEDRLGLDVIYLQARSGKGLSEVPRFKSLLVCFMESAPERGSSSRPALFRRKR